MRQYFLLDLLAMGCLQATAQDTFSISGQDWQFFYAKNQQTADSLAATGFGQRDYEPRGFRQTPVPSNWAVLGYEEPVYRGFPNDEASEGFYMKKFKAPKSFRGKRILLHFGGVWNSAEVWVNGKWLGRHDSGYTSFSYNVSGLVKGDTLNTIAVRVRQVYPGYKTDTYDDWTLGGIYRDVTLEAMPHKQWIDNVRVQTTFSKDYSEADVTVRTIVVNTTKNTLPGNYQSPGRDYQLRISLTAPDGTPVSTKDVTVKGHVSTSRDTKTVLHLKDPQKWTAETPYLYKLCIQLMGSDGKPTQTHTEKIGIREISTTGGVFRINGQPVKLRGVNRHDEHPDVGRAVGPKHWLEDLQLMKAANINYVRACHYQHAKGFIEMCDSIGMYVGAEVSLGGASQLMYDPSFVGAVMLRTQETVERDLNNPSIVYWSVGNEDPFTYMHLRAIRTVKGIDPTRPVLMPWNASELLPEEIDILAPHYWTSYEYDSLAAQSKRPIITTEYVHAYGEMRFGGLEDCFKALHKHPAGAGGAVWMWADQGLRTPTKKDPKVYGSLAKDDPTLRISAAGWDGITDSYRRPTRDYQEVKAVYAPVYPDVERVSLPKNAKTVNIPIRNDYDFSDIDDVDIRWQLFVDSRELDGNTSRVSAAPHATAPLAVSLSRLGTISEGQTCYVRLTFNRNGQEIARRHVELEPYKLSKAKAEHKALSLEQNSKAIIVKAGNNTYEFSRSTGLIASIKRNGKTAVGSMRPTIWHSLNEGDQIIKNRNFESGKDPERAIPTVKKVDAAETANGIVVTAEVDYVIDSNNTFSASYTQTIDKQGRLLVDYTIRPQVQMTYLPIVGMAVGMTSAADLKQWFGLGPLDAYPNKKAACTLGVWDAKEMAGTRQARWAEITTGSGIGTHITVDGYIDRDKVSSKELRVLSQVLGRAEKGRLNDKNYQVLPNTAYSGSLTIMPR
ncbi:MAG: glycoside hydrolase family 2 [Prevotella sp.]|nr:glycoside hydrolase family 2 [Prevotella sp.]